MKAANKIMKSLLGSLALVPAALLLDAPASAQDILWEFEATFDELTEGGDLSGYFIVEPPRAGATIFDRIAFWDIQIEDGAGNTEYYSGYGDHTKVENGPNVDFQAWSGPTFESVLSMELLSGLLPDDGGLVVLPAWTTFEYVDDGGFVRFVAEPMELHGYNLSDAAENDIYSEGGRLAEVAQAGKQVDLIGGGFSHEAVLLRGSSPEMPITFEIFYDSTADELGTGGVGKKWNHNFEWYLVGQETSGGAEAYAGSLEVIRADRAADYFNFTEDALENVTIEPQFPQSRTKLEFDDAAGELIYTNYAGLRYIFNTEQGFDATIEDEDGNEEDVFVFYLTAIENLEGLRMQLDYEDLGEDGLRLQAVVGPAPAEPVANFYYDAQGCITHVDYEFGELGVDLTYDASQNLTSFTSATNPGLTSRFTYDAESRLLTGRLSGGGAADHVFVSNTYDAEGCVVAQVDSKGGTTTFAYEELTGDPNPDAAWRATVTDPAGNVSTRTFDDQDRTIAATNSAGEEFSWCYDEDGNLCESTGPLGTRRTVYSEAGTVICLIDELGQELDLEWASGGLKSLTDDLGRQLQYEYDEDGNLESFVNTVGAQLLFEHDELGRLTKTTDYLGRIYENVYDELSGQLTLTKTPTGDITRTYDSQGRVTSTTDQNGNTRSMTYAPSGAMSSFTAANGQKTTITTDALGRAIREVNPNGVSIDFERDSAGNVTATRDIEGNRIAYTYDGMGRYTSRRDPAGMLTTFEHHPNGEMMRATDAMGGVASATFTASGQKASVTDPNGNTTTYQHDSLGRVTFETDPLGRTVENAYGDTGAIAAVINARGDYMSFTYEGGGGRLSSIWSWTEMTEYSYDLANRRTQTLRTDAQGQFSTAVAYHADSGLIASRVDEQANSVGYDYDAVGNLTTLTYSDGKQVHYTYDSRNRMTSVSDWNGRTTTYSYTGLTARATMPDGSTQETTFDKCGRVAEVVAKTASGEVTYSGSWKFDACGRTISVVETLPVAPTIASSELVIDVDDANQISSVNGIPFTYDADGNLTQAVIEGVPMTMTYDVQNRLVGVNSEAVTFDADGFRTKTDDGLVATYRVWDVTSGTQRLLEERDGAGNILRRYVHGLGLIAQEDASTGSLAIYHYDRQGSTVALTDMGGNITDRYAYAPYGALVTREGSTPNPFTYNGRDGVFDRGDGIYSMRSRDYIPSLGRFLQKEPAYKGSLANPASLNHYAFVEGNPIDRIDPRGELFNFITGPIGAGIGAVAGGVSQVVSNAVQGKPAFNNVAGAALNGAVTGGAVGFAGPGGLAVSTAVLAGGLGGAAGNALNQGIAIAQGKQDNFDLLDMAIDTGIGGVTGGLVEKIPFAKTEGPKNGFKKLSEVGLTAFKKVGAGVGKGLGSGYGVPFANELYDDFTTGAAGAGADYDLSYPPEYAQYGFDSADISSAALDRGEEADDLDYWDSLENDWGLDDSDYSSGEYLNGSYDSFYGVNLNEDWKFVR